jgi:hypothetical protein
LIPANAVALIVFLVFVAPGYVYRRVVERYVDRGTPSTLTEVVDLLCVGALCTVVSAAVALLGSVIFPGALLTLDDLRAPGAQPTWRLVWTVLIILGLASVLAAVVGAGRIRLVRRSADRTPGTVWSATFDTFSSAVLAGGSGGPVPLYLVLQLEDGATVAGQLLFGDLAADPEQRDIALAAPIWATDGATAERKPRPHEFVIVAGKKITAIWGYPLRGLQGGKESEGNGHG